VVSSQACALRRPYAAAQHVLQIESDHSAGSAVAASICGTCCAAGRAGHHAAAHHPVPRGADQLADNIVVMDAGAFIARARRCSSSSRRVLQPGGAVSPCCRLHTARELIAKTGSRPCTRRGDTQLTARRREIADMTRWRAGYGRKIESTTNTACPRPSLGRRVPLAHSGTPRPKTKRRGDFRMTTVAPKPAREHRDRPRTPHHRPASWIMVKRPT